MTLCLFHKETMCETSLNGFFIQLQWMSDSRVNTLFHSQMYTLATHAHLAFLCCYYYYYYLLLFFKVHVYLTWMINFDKMLGKFEPSIMSTNIMLWMIIQGVTFAHNSFLHAHFTMDRKQYVVMLIANKYNVANGS